MKEILEEEIIEVSCIHCKNFQFAWSGHGLINQPSRCAKGLDYDEYNYKTKTCPYFEKGECQNI